MKPLTVGDLRRAIATVPDDAELLILGATSCDLTRFPFVARVLDTEHATSTEYEAGAQKGPVLHTFSIECTDEDDPIWSEPDDEADARELDALNEDLAAAHAARVDEQIDLEQEKTWREVLP